MKSRIRLMVLALAVAVNAAALAALHRAMVDGAERARLTASEPERVVITATREAAELAKSNCPGANAL